MTQIRTILFALDFSPESDRAFEHARLLAECFEARLTIYHALEMRHAEDARENDVADDRWGEAERKVREELARRVSHLTVPHEIVVQRGPVGGHILVDLAVLAMIHETGPDLTVMATHARKGFASFFVGSVTEQVVQHAGRPVLCVRKAAHGLVLPYRRVLVPTDFSPGSRRAFSIAALLAREFESKVTVLHIRTAPPAAPSQGPGVPRVPNAADLRAFVQPEFGDYPIDARVCPTRVPWRQIVETAEEEKTDLIVMATEGLDSLHDRIIGNNTERVLRHAPCTVLVT